MEHNRLLSADEVNLLLDFSLSSDLQWNVLISTENNVLFEQIKDILSSRDDIILQRVHSGCDTLIMCAREFPDLLLIDDTAEDLPAQKIIECLKRHESMEAIHIIHMGDDMNPDKAAPADDFLDTTTIDPAFVSRRIIALLYTTYDPTSELTEPDFGRRWPRTVLNVAATMEVHGQTEKTTGSGQAVVENISRGGAWISEMNLGKDTPIHEDLQLRLTIDNPMLKDWHADAVVVRLKPDGAAGLKFVDISQNDQIKICELFDE